METLNKLRAPKINGIAAFDLIGTAIISFALACGVNHFIKKNIFVVSIVSFLFLMILAIILHVAVKMPTMLNHYLGLNSLEDVIQGRIDRGE
jgi:hypothetical protein